MESPDFIKANLARESTEKTQGELVKHKNGYLGKGQESPAVTRSHINIKRHGRERSTGNLAFKEFSDEDSAAYALRIWVHLKKIGIAVPQTFRLVEETGKYTGIIMTDLTKNWTQVFLGTNPTKRYNLSKTLECNPKVVQDLANIDINNPQLIKDIEDQIEDLAKKAAENNIEFKAGDVISITFDGEEAKIIISDMLNVKLSSEKSYQELYDEALRIGAGALELLNFGKEEAQKLLEK